MNAQAYWIDGHWPGRLAIVPRPRGGDWLADEMRLLKATGFDIVVSMLEPEEELDLELRHECELAEAQGLAFVSLPIRDRSVPRSASWARPVLDQVEAHLRDGRNVAIHCRQGIGRSSIVAALLLGIGGLDAHEVWTRIESSRGRTVPDTAEQRDWTERAMQQLGARAGIADS